MLQKEQAHPTFDVQAPRTPEHQILSSSSSVESVPLTIRNESDEETDSDSDGTDSDKRDLKNLTFDEFVNGDAKRDKQGITKEIKKMKAEFSEKYHKIYPENKWKLPSGKFAEDILYEYTLNLEYER